MFLHLIVNVSSVHILLEKKQLSLTHNDSQCVYIMGSIYFCRATPLASSLDNKVLVRPWNNFSFPMTAIRMCELLDNVN